MGTAFGVGDRVIRNPATWQPNEFDSWGRGVGVGVVVEPPFALGAGEVDVRWPGGRCFEFVEQLLPAPAEMGTETVATPDPAPEAGPGRPMPDHVGLDGALRRYKTP